MFNGQHSKPNRTIPFQTYNINNTPIHYLFTTPYQSLTAPKHNNNLSVSSSQSLHLSLNPPLMVMSWKTRFGRRAPTTTLEVAIPAHFRCPVSLELMKDPVTLPTGITYDRASIEAWLGKENSMCPVTNRSLTGDIDLVPNHSLRIMIQDWCVANRALGIDRIPTPRAPVTAAQVSKILSEISDACRRGDRTRCHELVVRIKALGKESERNRRCIVSNGAGRVLAAAFGAFARDLSSRILEDILSVLPGVFPLDEEARQQIVSPESMKSIVLIADSGDPSGKLNAVLVIKEIVSSSTEMAAIAATGGLVEALVKLIKEPISPRATKAALTVTFHLVSSGKNISARFAETDLVSPLLDILVDAEKSICEKAVGVLDGLFSCRKGRELGYAHALAVPVLVKKMFRVSEAATEFAVSALWKLCRNGTKEGGGCAVEALQVGVFQKLLLLLQVGCSEATKEKASSLLRLLDSSSRTKLECMESVDLRGLKRPL